MHFLKWYETKIPIRVLGQNLLKRKINSINISIKPFTGNHFDHQQSRLLQLRSAMLYYITFACKCVIMFKREILIILLQWHFVILACICIMPHEQWSKYWKYWHFLHIYLAHQNFFFFSISFKVIHFWKIMETKR